MSSNETGLDATDVGDIRTRSVKDPERDEAREAHDPHSWSEEKIELLDRITPDNASEGIGIAFVGIVILGFLWYLGPIFRSLVTNPMVFGAVAALLVTGAIYLKGRQDGIEAIQQLDKSILFYGDDADIRFCRESGVEGRSTTVEPVKNLWYGGIRATPLQLTDIPMQADKLKSKQDGHSDPGEKPVRDRLNQSTVTKHTETFGKVHVTHCSALDYDDYGRNSDRYAEPPFLIDEDVASEYHEQLTELKHQYQQLEHQMELLEQANEEMRSLKKSQTVPQFEQMMDSFEDLLEMLGQRRAPRNGSTNGTSGMDKLRKNAEEMEVGR